MFVAVCMECFDLARADHVGMNESLYSTTFLERNEIEMGRFAHCKVC